MPPPTLPPSAIVIGGSITGLLQALSLKRQGCNVIILEKDPSEDRGSHGSGIQVGPTVVALLKKYDKTGRTVTLPADTVSWFWRKSSRRISKSGGGGGGGRQAKKHMANWGALYQLLRANFDGLVSATVPNPPERDPDSDGWTEYRAGKLVTGIRYEYGEVRVTYKDVLTDKIDTIGTAMVFAADGVHSTARELMGTPAHVEEAGYLAWRGSVCEDIISPRVVDHFERRLGFVAVRDGYFVVYIIPSSTGDLTRGTRLINWVWYCPRRSHSNLSDTPDGPLSLGLPSIFTDTSGVLHRTTVPPGKLDPRVWSSQFEPYRSSMPIELAEVVSKSTAPFVTKVVETSLPHRQLPSPSSYSFLDSRLVLIGDALATHRPHMGGATEQGAFHVAQMERLFKGKITMAQRDKEARAYAEKFRLMNRVVGFAGLRDLRNLTKTLGELAWLKIKS